MPKIISERCEFVKLCHINRSGPFFETQCMLCHELSVCLSLLSVKLFHRTHIILTTTTPKLFGNIFAPSNSLVLSMDFLLSGTKLQKHSGT